MSRNRNKGRGFVLGKEYTLNNKNTLFWFTESNGKRIGMWRNQMQTFYEKDAHTTTIRYQLGPHDSENHDVLISFGALMQMIGSGLTVKDATKALSANVTVGSMCGLD